MISQQTNTAEALKRYKNGEKLQFSTGIHDGITWGYGKLDHNGFFEFEVPYSFLNKSDQEFIDEMESK